MCTSSCVVTILPGLHHFKHFARVDLLERIVQPWPCILHRFLGHHIAVKGAMKHSKKYKIRKELNSVGISTEMHQPRHFLGGFDPRIEKEKT